MKETKKILTLMAIFCSLALTSCGYVSDKPIANLDVFKSDDLQTCKIDVSKLGDIFKENQEEQIRCLKENFLQFTRYVRPSKPGSVSETELGAFVKKFFEGQSESIIKGLSLIFQLNMILLKDESDRISNSNITPLFELLVKVNQEAVVLTSIIRDMDNEKNQDKFWELRAKFVASIGRFSNFTVAIIEKSPGMQQQLNIRKFILDLGTKIDGIKIEEETVDAFIFLKRLLVAGDKEVITTNELKLFITKLPSILTMVFDIFYVKGSNFKNDTAEMRFYLEKMRDVYTVVQFNQPNFELVTTNQLALIAGKFISAYNVKKFQPSIEALKKRLIGGKADSITLTDMHAALDIGHDFLERIYFNSVTYDSDKIRLERAESETIKEYFQKDLPGYDVFTKERVSVLHESFADVLKNFRYYRNKDSGVLYYGTNIQRTKYGLIEVAGAKWLATKLITSYGHKSPKGELVVSIEEFTQFLLDARPLLEEFRLWSPNFSTFARNSVLLADLFQQQSDGDLNIGINEATEYVSMILSAVEVSGRINKNLTGLCDPGLNGDDPLFEVSCYNDNFYDLVLNKLEYRKFFPRLSMYIQSAPRHEVDNYLKGVQGFARDDNSPGVPMNRRDSTLVLGAMLNIESTFIRFDKNRDNIIEYKELVEAFKVYRESIIALAKLGPAQEKYALSIFLYMASKMEIPPTGSFLDDVKFAAFHQCASWTFCRATMDPIEAKRLNIGKILYYMVNQASTPKK